jgi:hypothetical protein
LLVFFLSIPNWLNLRNVWEKHNNQWLIRLINIVFNFIKSNHKKIGFSCVIIHFATSYVDIASHTY